MFTVKIQQVVWRSTAYCLISPPLNLLMRLSRRRFFAFDSLPLREFSERNDCCPGGRHVGHMPIG